MEFALVKLMEARHQTLWIGGMEIVVMFHTDMVVVNNVNNSRVSPVNNIHFLIPRVRNKKIFIKYFLKKKI